MKPEQETLGPHINPGFTAKFDEGYIVFLDRGSIVEDGKKIYTTLNLKPSQRALEAYYLRNDEPEGLCSKNTYDFFGLCQARSDKVLRTMSKNELKRLQIVIEHAASLLTVRNQLSEFGVKGLTNICQNYPF